MDEMSEVHSGFRPGDRVRHRAKGWTGTVLTHATSPEAKVRVQTDEDSEWEGSIDAWSARNLEPIGARAQVWTVEQIDALHSLRQALDMPTPSDPLAVLETALVVIVGLLREES